LIVYYRSAPASFSRILRSPYDDAKRSYSRILKRANQDNDASKRAPFSRILRSMEEPSARELEDWLAAAAATAPRDLEDSAANDYYDPYFFTVHARAPGYSRIQ